MEENDKLPWGGVGIAIPMFLVALGVILLCNNLHFLAWNVWATIWRFWPIFLIATGLEYMLARRFKYGSLIVLVFMLAALVAAVVLHAAGRDKAERGRPLAAGTRPAASGMAIQSVGIIRFIRPGRRVTVIS